MLRLLPLEAILVLMAGALCFTRPGLAGAIFVAVGAWGVLNALYMLMSPDPTAPPGAATALIVGTALPLLNVGCLLLEVWWADRRARPSPTRTT